MDDLDRIFHRLVSNIRHRHSEYLTLPFTVQELYETLIPYRHHRRELGIETNQDYEIAMTRLLSGERDYIQTDQSMRDKLRAEVESSNMDPGAFREFASSKVSLAPEALRRIRALTVSGDEPGSTAPGTASEQSASATAASGGDARATASPVTVPVDAARHADIRRNDTALSPRHFQFLPRRQVQCPLHLRQKHRGQRLFRFPA